MYIYLYLYLLVVPARVLFSSVCPVALGQYDCYDDFFAEVGLTGDDLDEFVDDCLECESEDYTHYSILFNAFVFSQIFNEFNARSIFDEWNVFKGMSKNPLFLAIIIITVGLQVMLSCSQKCAV